LLELKFMNQIDYETYLERAIPKIAIEYVESGVCSREQSMDYAKAIINDVLKDGLETKDQFLFQVLKDGVSIGILWYGKRTEHEAFIYDIELDEAYRGKGLGKQVMLLAENHAKQNGYTKMTLHVFGHNQTAISLYQKMGYITFSMHMSKEI
jgi:ribosomal protein S18 acetylase RimI-like enzyme